MLERNMVMLFSNVLVELVVGLASFVAYRTSVRPSSPTREVILPLGTSTRCPEHALDPLRTKVLAYRQLYPCRWEMILPP
jgi:hypothetical protein